MFTYRDKVVAGGVAGLVAAGQGAGEPSGGAWGWLCKTEFLRGWPDGQFRRAKDAQAWIKKRTRKTLSESGALKVLAADWGGKLEGTLQKATQKKIPPKQRRLKWTCRGNWNCWPGPAALNRPTGATVGARRTPLWLCCRSSAESGANAASASSRAVCDTLSMGLPARSGGSRRGEPDGTALYSVHRPKTCIRMFLRTGRLMDPAALLACGHPGDQAASIRPEKQIHAAAAQRPTAAIAALQPGAQPPVREARWIIVKDRICNRLYPEPASTSKITCSPHCGLGAPRAPASRS